MNSKEFITEVQSIDEILDEISKIYNIEFKVMNKMQSIARGAGMKLNVIEPLIQISQQCQSYIQTVGWDNCFDLYRGIPEYSEFIKKRVRLDNRIPKSMDPYLFEEINKYFTEAYGAPFRNAMLCTGQLSHTRLFGEAYMVFPIGDFKYLWHPEVNDLNFASANFRNSDIVQNNVEGSVWGTKNRDLINDLFLNEYIKKIDWQTTDMSTAVASNVEIMIRTKAYHGVRYKDHKMDIYEMTEIMKLAI